MIFALIAVALSPLAYWVLGPSYGVRQHGTSSPWERRAYVLAYFAAVAAATWQGVIAA